MTFISIHSLTKSYTKGKSSINPLENLSLDVPRGEFLALMGPSGSGKTTLLNLIAGIDSPTMGELVVDGRDIAKLSRTELTHWRASHVGYIFQLYHLVPILSAFENVELPLLLGKLSKSQRREKVNAALDLVDGKTSEYTDLEMVRKQPMAFPPEPFRYAGIQMTRRAIARSDAREGRRGMWLKALDRFGVGFDS